MFFCVVIFTYVRKILCRFGMMPFRLPITTVIGAPIPTVKNPAPTQEEIDDVHQRYMDDLKYESWRRFEEFSKCRGREGKRPMIAYCFTQCANGSSSGSLLLPRQDNHADVFIRAVHWLILLFSLYCRSLFDQYKGQCGFPEEELEFGDWQEVFSINLNLDCEFLPTLCLHFSEQWVFK